MGGIVSGLLTNTKSGSNAANLQAAANREATAEIKRQFDLTSENVQPFLEAGRGAIPGVVEASTPEGFAERIRQLFSGGALDPIIDERTRAVQNQLAAGGLTRSGAGARAIADVPTDLVLQIENLLTGRGQNLVAGGQNAALNLGQLGGNVSGQIAGLHQDTGRAHSQGSLLNDQIKAKRNEKFIQGGEDLISALLTFSDPILKENIETIGRVGKLNIYQWDWIKEAKNTIVEKFPTIGFMADEVKLIHPEYVHEVAGLDAVDYGGLLNRLESQYA